MQDPLPMRVLHRLRHLRHQRHRSSRLATQCWGRVQQTAPAGKRHAEKRQPIVTLAHLRDWQDVRMKETRCSLRLAPKTQQRLSRFGMIRQNSFKRHDVAPVSRPIIDAYATASDLFEYLVLN